LALVGGPDNAMTPPALSVVVPAYNAAETLGDCLAALAAQAYDAPYEVIVVDDGSTDATAAIARAAGVTVITTPRGRPAAARNAGARAAQAPIVCFTDADCAPHPDWLCEVSAPFADPIVVATKGTYTTRQRALVARFVQLEYEDKYDLLRPQPSIDFIDTYSCAYRRDVLLGNGGFDERFQYLEDQELSFRLAARGYRMVFAERAVVAHRHSATLPAYLRKKATIGYWKAQVVRRFPGQIVRDSHTPQVMKVQMALAAAALAGLVAGAALMLVNQTAGLWVLGLAGAVLLAFLMTALPFVAKAWGKDRAVAAAAPALLFGRAAALGWGYARGVLAPRRDIGGEGLSAPQRAAKRALDVVGAVVGLMPTALLMPFLVLFIRADSAGPVFFRQARVGQNGRPFVMLKFRTMHVGAADQLPALAASLGLSEPVLKLPEDPRLTTVGRFLRRWSLDELPQFWNVLRGEMSLVGPRPEEPRVVAHYAEWQRRRLVVRPGITGPMQISGRADLPLDERVRLDLEYIDHYSLWRDGVILLRTIPVVLRGTGAR
jgi:lipopolysaccharide/colanic/teichoic acid biosynthesis glycosyltransferase